MNACVIFIKTLAKHITARFASQDHYTTIINTTIKHACINRASKKNVKNAYQFISENTSICFIQPLDISEMKYFKDRFKFHSKNKEFPILRPAMQSNRQHVINCALASILNISQELIKIGFQKMLTL